MSQSNSASVSRRGSSSFRVGRVAVYRRGSVWWLRYHEHGQRQQVRGAVDKQAARQLASDVNAQLESGIPAATSFQPVPVAQLRQAWLDHHEHVKRSSVATIARYQTATLHLVNYVQTQGNRLKLASNIGAREAEGFARWLRTIEVAPNGHKNSVKRRLLDKGVQYVLECCRSLFAYAIKRRHLPPYTENPFAMIEIEAMRVEDAKPIVLLTTEEESAFLEACDAWERPIFLTLMLTGLRPGELSHLLLPGDFDLSTGVLRVTNKPRLGWQIKTRSEREIPLHPLLVEVLRPLTAQRTTGAVFQQRRCSADYRPPLAHWGRQDLEREAAARVARAGLTDRRASLSAQRTVWRDLAALDDDDVRQAFIRICRRIGLSHQTAPKVLRHGFATMLQDANVDPLIRNQLMGHSIGSAGSSVVRPVGLGMTAVYTHTRFETLKRELFRAIDQHVAANRVVPRA